MATKKEELKKLVERERKLMDAIKDTSKKLKQTSEDNRGDNKKQKAQPDNA